MKIYFHSEFIINSIYFCVFCCHISVLWSSLWDNVTTHAAHHFVIFGLSFSKFGSSSGGRLMNRSVAFSHFPTTRRLGSACFLHFRRSRCFSALLNCTSFMCSLYIGRYFSTLVSLLYRWFGPSPLQFFSFGGKIWIIWWIVHYLKIIFLIEIVLQFVFDLISILFELWTALIKLTFRTDNKSSRM